MLVRCLAVVFVVVFRLGSLASAQDGFAPPTPRERTSFGRALCPAHTRCRIESTLPAGTAEGHDLAVVRVRIGDAPEPECRAYVDWLVSTRPVRVIRALVFSDVPCLEREESTWTFEGGELVFHYGGLGVPASPADSDFRAHVYLRPAPLAIVREILGRESIAELTPLPAEGPVFVLSMDEEGVREDWIQHPLHYGPRRGQAP